MIYNASAYEYSSYNMANGTSMSTPLVAGVATLVRSTRPDLTPIQVRDAIRNTADNASEPQDRRGWGLVNAWDAVLYHGLVFSTNPRVYFENGAATFRIYALSKSPIEGVTVTYSVDGGNDESASMHFEGQYSGLGANAGLYSFTFPEIPVGAAITCYVSSADTVGPRTAPYNAPENRFTFRIGDFPSGFELYQSYPNPIDRKVHPEAAIQYAIPEAGSVTIRLYDISGRYIATVFDGLRTRGTYVERFNTAGLARGVYYYVMDYNGRRKTLRMYIDK
jgi:hypothetical protein